MSEFAATVVEENDSEVVWGVIFSLVVVSIVVGKCSVVEDAMVVVVVVVVVGRESRILFLVCMCLDVSPVKVRDVESTIRLVVPSYFNISSVAWWISNWFVVSPADGV